jgi:hypothetical protein
MWPTSEGNRMLRDSEAVLLATAIDTILDPLVDYLGTDEEGEQESSAAVLQTGISVFDSLSIGQRIAVLHHAAHYLLTDAPFPCNSLSAIDDATIAAIYVEVRDQVEIEIDFSNSSSSDASDVDHTNGSDQDPLMHWRHLVHDACRDALGEGAWSEITSNVELASVELGEWELWIDCLASAILWDRDFEFTESFLDADPETARSRRKILGITDDYFIRPAPDPDYRRINHLIRKTRQLVRSIHSTAPSDHCPLEDDPSF